MKKFFSFFILSVFTLCVFNSCQSEDQWQSLFNGEDLSGWDTWVGPTEENGEPLGLNENPMNLFSVVEVDGEKAIRISGEINASLATKEEFEDYHLVMEFKWGDEVFTRFNSGLLYHSYGDFGVGLDVWMSGHEMQMWTGNLGDSYRMGKSYCEIPMTQNEDDQYVYSAEAEKIPSIPDTPTRIVAKNGDYENPMGEWNKIEIYCVGRTSVHVVNGNVNMVNYNSGKYLGENNIEPLTKGKIQIQSEGGELFIRSIKTEPISEIPEELLPNSEM